ncbi:MAG TPA: DUF3224 domain-containing protein [Luteimonas sp.]|nr:DUF3224 domain-containing protein [Luteimonas sp.]HRO26196.1 DUF3224 domain-containing protein [Luteimonas sp.]HRP73716.1 DUF3224 domain-containing protein [Luteimonas sp.]
MTGCRMRPGPGLTYRCAAGILLLLLSTGVASAREARVSNVAKGEFTVAIEPLALENVEDGDTRGRMTIDKRITGDLVATTRGQMLTGMTGEPGSAVYVAIERVSGTLDGRAGSFLLHHRGIMDRGAQDLSVSVVPDSGTGGLTGIAGEFRILIEGGRHRYEFTWSLPATD